MKVRLIAKTVICNEELLNELKNDTPEELIMFCARVSSPDPFSGDEKLLKYCVKKAHWSVFSMSDMVVEIETTRGIAPQILRHKSFDFQEFSLRYANANGFEVYPGRSQDIKNRQNSIDNLDVETQSWFMQSQQIINGMADNMYNEALNKGIAKECARNLLTMGTKTKLYMKGSVRSWIHYLQIRTGPETQKEHRDIALAIKEIFVKNFPVIAKSLDWNINK